MSGVAVRVLAADVLARLQGMEDRGQNLSGVMRNFGEYMKGSIDKNFAAEGRPAPWARLKLGTLSGWAVSKKSFTTKKGLLSKTGREALAGRKVLTDKGLLRNATFYIVRGNSLQMVNDNPVATIHQLGAKIPPIFPKSKKALFWPGAAYPVKGTKGGIIPARPFMIFQDEDINYFEQTLVDFVMNGRLT